MQTFIKKYLETGFGSYGYTPVPSSGATAWSNDNNALASTDYKGSSFNWNSLIKDTLGNAGGIINAIGNLTNGTTPPAQNVTYVNGMPNTPGRISMNTIITIGGIILLLVILIVVVMMVSKKTAAA